MKIIRFLLFCVSLIPLSVNAAPSEFSMAAQLLAAAKNADVQQVQALVNNGANVNFVDSTGLSIVCTALMNNDVRAAQILQMYGADASRCDVQIKRYNSKNKPKSTGGLFGGLSSAQSLTLAAAGAAVVAGGLLLLTDVFDPGNENANGIGTGGERPNQGGGSGGGSSGVTAFLSVPYSPAYVGSDGKVDASSTVYVENLAEWNPDIGGIKELDFNYFNPTVQIENNYSVDGITVPVQNYLLMMHGYSAFANEYMGQKIFRTGTTNVPVAMQNDAGGGMPVGVAVITDNGINPTGSGARADGISYALSTAVDEFVLFVDKYLNYANPVNGVLGAEQDGFDLSASGTAMNPYASAYDSALGKIIAGWSAGERSYGDFFGFVPYGRLGVYRTGGGLSWETVETPTDGVVAGTLIDSDSGTENVIESGDKIVVDGITYDVILAVESGVTRPTITINGNVLNVAENSTLLKGVCDSDANADCADVSDIAIYYDDNGNYYVNTTGGVNADAVYVVNDGNLYVSKILEDSDYKNFQALSVARASSGAAVLANLSVLDSARNATYLTLSDMPALIALGSGNATDVYMAQIDAVYDRNDDDSTSQGAYANKMFNAYGSRSPILVMPAGEVLFGTGQGQSMRAQDATFENYAPLLYGANLEHNFMTVVAVNHTIGTKAADSIEDYGNGTGDAYGKLYLSMWNDNRGTVDTGDDLTIVSRQCGIAGVGQNGIDPWCFSSAGATAEMATASAAGAVASVKAAFDYMTNKDIFYLLALTADGYLLGTDSTGTAFTQETLAAYLKNMYALPQEYYESTLSAADYLNAFAQVYGYGLINLDRAMKPNHTIYYYDGNSIVSASGNAYWRGASNTMFRPSTVLNLRGASVRAPFYDVIESVDGTVSMPRVWQNEFALGGADKRGLYMGDLLADLDTREKQNETLSVGDFSLSMSFSERPYFDYLNGLDNLKLGYDHNNWKFQATYQQDLTDGLSKTNAMVNPILGLTSNAITADVAYKFGDFSFGTRLFSGAITDDGLLENDPTVSAQFLPAKLGLAQGGQADVCWEKYGLKFNVAFGVMSETNTLLGAYTDGLLNLGNGLTNYVDFVAGYDVAEKINITARATFANTVSDVSGGFIMGLTDIKSNSFAVGLNFGNFEFSLSQPLAITDGNMKYAYADYSVEEKDGKYVLNVNDMHIEDLSLRPEKRELRLTGLYRHKFGEFTDGALGFVYRVNPEHTDEFGNESVFMLKLTHRLGI